RLALFLSLSLSLSGTPFQPLSLTLYLLASLSPSLFSLPSLSSLFCSHTLPDSISPPLSHTHSHTHTHTHTHTESQVQHNKVLWICFAFKAACSLPYTHKHTHTRVRTQAGTCVQ